MDEQEIMTQETEEQLPELTETGEQEEQPDEDRDAPEAEEQEQDAPEQDEPEQDGQELPELRLPAQPVQPARDERHEVLDEAMALMGLSDAQELLKQLEESAVSKLVAAGAPDALAREVVKLRREARANRARDEPARSAPAVAPEADPPSPEIKKLAEQADYIRQRTGVDMVEETRKNPEMRRRLSEYAAGKGRYDMYAAYEELRQARTSGRKRVPPTTVQGGGLKGSGKRDVKRMSDAELEELEARALRGESITL